MDDELQAAISELLTKNANTLSDVTSESTLEDVAFHDFGAYEFLLDPSGFNELDLSPLSVDGAQYIDDLESTGSAPEILEYMADMLIRLEASVRKGCIDGLPAKEQVSGSGLGGFQLSVAGPSLPGSVLRALYREHRRLIRQIVDLDRSVPDFFGRRLYTIMRQQAAHMALVLSGSVATDGTGYSNPLFDWVEFIEATSWWVAADNLEVVQVNLENDLISDFQIYPAGSINVGIALTYRQRWKPLGMQAGEIVKTIPLAPGQSEKVSTKITRRRKSSSNRESEFETVSSVDTNTTSKDSSDIINEASSESDWRISASASYGIGGVGFGASASGETGGSKASSTKGTASKLSETMKKTASKVRRRTKVQIATEFESGFEVATVSEVHNPNDDEPITLNYHMLQRQYEVSSHLQNVKNAIFVAERIPAPYEVNIDWLRRYDWIISDVLLDESFRKTLNQLIQEENNEALVSFGDTNPYNSMFEKARDRFAQFETPGNADGVGGLDVDDIYAEPMRQFDQFRKGEEARRRENSVRNIQRRRLITHIRDNILHYCRAIWAKEDNEQRIMRYRKEGLTLPFVWQGPVVQDLGDAGIFSPTDLRVPIDRVIDDIEPIGFSGNYIVFSLAAVDDNYDGLIEAALDLPAGAISLPLPRILDIMRSAYTDPTGTRLRDPALDLFIADAQEEIDLNNLRALPDTTVEEFLSLVPELESQLRNDTGFIRDGVGLLRHQITHEEWGTFQFRKNNTRRFLVDSNNLYVSITQGSGSALEPFKRIHRFLDVLQADEERKAEALKNARREALRDDPAAFDPDITKVVVVSGKVSTSDIAGDVVGDDDDPALDGPTP